MKISSATPVLYVDRVEPTRDFFQRVGFEAAMEVPDGDVLGFSMLVKDGVQVMVETRANGREPEALRRLMGESRRAAVFIDVDDLDAVIGMLAGAQVLVARHETFYGSQEISFEEPGGNIVTFAQFKK